MSTQSASRKDGVGCGEVLSLVLKVAPRAEESGLRGAAAEYHRGLSLTDLTVLSGGRERLTVTGHYGS